MGNGKMTKTYIWSLFTRLFHILLILGIAFLFLFSDFDSLLSYHAIIGYSVGLLLLFRIVWGFMDVKYSSFRDFNFSFHDLQAYMLDVFTTLKELISNPERKRVVQNSLYVGHNPASSWAIVGMIAFGILSVFSGVVVYGTQEGMGILSFLNNTLFKKMEFFEELHEFFTTAFMFVMFAHISGALLDRFLHKSSAIESMIDGYKETQEEGLKLTFMQKLFGLVWIGTTLFFLFYLLSHPANLLIADATIEVDYKKEHPLFERECISCHTLYPPYLLPSQSWVKMMADLQNHFGDDASLDANETQSIRDYLVKNAAENSTKESAYKMLRSMQDRETIAITKTPYWIRRHHEIDESVFVSKEVKAKSNCKACHQKIEQGLLNDKEIKIPEIAKG
jgi:cytochrome b